MYSPTCFYLFKLRTLPHQMAINFNWSTIITFKKIQRLTGGILIWGVGCYLYSLFFDVDSSSAAINSMLTGRYSDFNTTSFGLILITAAIIKMMTEDAPVGEYIFNPNYWQCGITIFVAIVAFVFRISFNSFLGPFEVARDAGLVALAAYILFLRF